MTPKALFCAVAWMAFGVVASAQRVSGIYAVMSGDNVTISYNLDAKSDADISVYALIGQNEIKLSAVKGDVGGGVSPGEGKRIVWSPLSEPLFQDGVWPEDFRFVIYANKAKSRESTEAMDSKSQGVKSRQAILAAKSDRSQKAKSRQAILAAKSDRSQKAKSRQTGQSLASRQPQTRKGRTPKASEKAMSAGDRLTRMTFNHITISGTGTSKFIVNKNKPDMKSIEITSSRGKRFPHEKVTYNFNVRLTSLNGFAYGNDKLTSLDIDFSTEAVTDMSAMFQGCESLTTLYLSDFSTEAVTDMSAMFQGCNSLKHIYVSPKCSVTTIDKLVQALHAAGLNAEIIRL